MEALELAREIGLWEIGQPPYSDSVSLDTPEKQKAMTNYLKEKDKRQQAFIEKWNVGTFRDGYFNSGCDCFGRGSGPFGFQTESLSLRNMYGRNFHSIKMSRGYKCDKCGIKWNVDPLLKITNPGDTTFTIGDIVKATEVIKFNFEVEKNGLKPADVVLAPNPFGG